MDERCRLFADAAAPRLPAGPALTREVTTLRRFLFKNQGHRFTDGEKARLHAAVQQHFLNPSARLPAEGHAAGGSEALAVLLLEDALKMPFTVFSTAQKGSMLKWYWELLGRQQGGAEGAEGPEGAAAEGGEEGGRDWEEGARSLLVVDCSSFIPSPSSTAAAAAAAAPGPVQRALLLSLMDEDDGAEYCARVPADGLADATPGGRRLWGGGGGGRMGMPAMEVFRPLQDSVSAAAHAAASTPAAFHRVAAAAAPATSAASPAGHAPRVCVPAAELEARVRAALDAGDDVRARVRLPERASAQSLLLSAGGGGAGLVGGARGRGRGRGGASVGRGAGGSGGKATGGPRGGRAGAGAGAAPPKAAAGPGSAECLPPEARLLSLSFSRGGEVEEGEG